MNTVRKTQSPSAVISDCVMFKGIDLNFNMVDGAYVTPSL